MAYPVPPAPMPRPPRRFFADDILSGSVTLDAYPFRYILVTPTATGMFGNTLFSPGMMAEIDKVLAAAEFLETRGWEVVNVEERGMIAYLRRRRPE